MNIFEFLGVNGVGVVNFSLLLCVGASAVRDFEFFVLNGNVKFLADFHEEFRIIFARFHVIVNCAKFQNVEGVTAAEASERRVVRDGFVVLHAGAVGSAARIAQRANVSGHASATNYAMRLKFIRRDESDAFNRVARDFFDVICILLRFRLSFFLFAGESVVFFAEEVVSFRRGFLDFLRELFCNFDHFSRRCDFLALVFVHELRFNFCHFFRRRDLFRARCNFRTHFLRLRVHFCDFQISFRHFVRPRIFFCRHLIFFAAFGNIRIGHLNQRSFRGAAIRNAKRLALNVEGVLCFIATENFRVRILRRLLYRRARKRSAYGALIF